MTGIGVIPTGKACLSTSVSSLPSCCFSRGRGILSPSHFIPTLAFSFSLSSKFILSLSLRRRVGSAYLPKPASVRERRTRESPRERLSCVSSINEERESTYKEGEREREGATVKRVFREGSVTERGSPVTPTWGWKLPHESVWGVRPRCTGRAEPNASEASAVPETRSRTPLLGARPAQSTQRYDPCWTIVVAAALVHAPRRPSTRPSFSKPP